MRLQGVTSKTLSRAFAVTLPLIIEVGEQQLVNVRFAPIADKNGPPHETLRVPEAEIRCVKRLVQPLPKDRIKNLPRGYDSLAEARRRSSKPSRRSFTVQLLK